MYKGFPYDCGIIATSVWKTSKYGVCMLFTSMTPDQARMLADAENHYFQWVDAKRNFLVHNHWMGWRQKGGTEYLTSSRGGGTSQRSHGARSPETEALYDKHLADKANSKLLLDDIEGRLAERAPLLRATRLGRVLAPLARVVREFDMAGLLGVNLRVGGTHALAAYESLAGQLLDAQLSATEDLDLIWHASDKAELVVRPTISLLAHLKSIDDTYTVNTENRFQVRNSKGMVIDFISDHENAEHAPKEYLKPIGIDGQQWLLDSKPVSAVAIDTSGLPVKLVVPDPRIFAIHKLWVSLRADRNQLKAPKDSRQAFAVASLVKSHMPQYPFDGSFISSLPDELRFVYETYLAEHLSASVDAAPIQM